MQQQLVPPADTSAERCPDVQTLLAGQLAAASLAAYQRDWQLYVRFCGSTVAAWQPASLARWRAHLAHATAISPHTINRRLAAIKRLAQEAALQGDLDEVTALAFARVASVPIKALKARTKATTRTRVTPGQMRQLCEAPDRHTLIGRRDSALLHTLASSGCRLGEVLALMAAHIVPQDGRFFLEVLGKNQTTPRQALLSQEAYACIQAWLARRTVESVYIFTSFAGRGVPTARPMDLSAAWRAVQRYATAVGLRHMKPHDFRRFVGTELARRDIRLAQKVLGHKSIETTARHYVLDTLEGGATDGLY